MQKLLFVLVCLYLSYYCLTFSRKLLREANRIGGIAVIGLNLLFIIVTFLIQIL